MLDIRIGVAIESDVDKQLSAICQKHGGSNKSLSKGDFLMAMVTMLSAEVQDQAIEAYKAKRDSGKEEKRQAKKELAKKVRSLTPEEIEMVMTQRATAAATTA